MTSLWDISIIILFYKVRPMSICWVGIYMRLLYLFLIDQACKVDCQFWKVLESGHLWSPAVMYPYPIIQVENVLCCGVLTIKATCNLFTWNVCVFRWYKIWSCCRSHQKLSTKKLMHLETTLTRYQWLFCIFYCNCHIPNTSRRQSTGLGFT